MKKILTIFLVLGAIYIPSAYAITGDEAIARFRGRMFGIKTATGVISWTTNTGMTYTGTFKYMNPGKIYVKFSSPHNKILVSNGKRLWIYDPANKICGIQDLAPGNSGGIAAMIKDYFALVTSKGSGGYTLKLKNAEKRYSEIQMKLDGSFMLQRLILKTEEGNAVSFTLSRVDTKAHVIKNIFDFSVPANTQIIKNPMDIR